ncbi:serine/threonine-protein kinase, partial [Planctomycetota bacterium]
MAITLEKFVRSLSESGLMTSAEVDAFLHGLPADRQPKDGKELAREMLRRKRLTKFQAQAVYDGKTRGLVLGNYVILDMLGEGGMGQVFKAQHRRMERTVALKVLAPAALKSPDLAERFQREVKAAARLSHPNVVTAYDADEERGVHFLVMEYVEGRDLAVVVEKEGPLPGARALDFILQAAAGLEYAHSQNVIHRDIKPANLLLDKSGTVKILDMGIARIQEEPTAADATAAAGLTADGAVLGTVDYMSPEQGLNTKNADALSDIYSLGCTLYWLVTGQPVFEGDTLVAKILAHREETIPSLRAERK